MQPYQQRVIDERIDLDAKIKRLADFLNGDAFRLLVVDEQNDLRSQLEEMKTYCGTLCRRIARF